MLDSNNIVIVEQLQDFLDKEPKIILAILFGSRSKGLESSSSDLDLGIAGGQEFSTDELAQLNSRLETILDIPVDLIDLRRAEGLILSKAITGRPLKENEALRGALALKALDFQAFLLPIINRARLSRAKEFAHGT